LAFKDGEVWVFRQSDLECFAIEVAAAARAAEREACAKIADSWNKNVVWENKMLAVNIAKEIRARGETK
jgi:hypothetical protein